MSDEITTQLTGKSSKEKAKIKATALADTSKVSDPGIIVVDGYRLTITSREYDAKTDFLVVTFTATDPKGAPVDLDGPYQYYNPPVRVFDKMVPNPDPKTSKEDPMIASYREDPVAALREMISDTIRYVLKKNEREKPGKEK